MTGKRKVTFLDGVADPNYAPSDFYSLPGGKYTLGSYAGGNVPNNQPPQVVLEVAFDGDENRLMEVLTKTMRNNPSGSVAFVEIPEGRYRVKIVRRNSAVIYSVVLVPHNIA